MDDAAFHQLAAGGSAGYSRNFVEFYMRPVQNKQKTLSEGRPIFDKAEFVRIQVPGDRTNIIDRPVRDEDKQNYRPQYEAFKSNKPQDEAAGTLLTAWGGIEPERAEELAFFKVRTVEQLAGVSDDNAQKMGPHTRKEREKAQQYIAATKGAAPMLQLKAELEEKDKRINALEAQVREWMKAQKKKENP